MQYYDDIADNETISCLNSVISDLRNETELRNIPITNKLITNIDIAIIRLEQVREKCKRIIGIESETSMKSLIKRLRKIKP